MKKRILALALCAVLLAAPFGLGTATAASPLSLIAINDTLPPDLINVMVYYGGAVYVPYWLLTGYGFGINYSYFANSSTAYLYNGVNQIFFELTSGKTYNSNDVEFAAPAIMWSGTVYLPLDFVCSAFGGLSFRTIGQNEYGSILRITTGVEVLSDDEFFRAAQGAMKRYYQAYNTAEPPEPTATAEPEPTDPPREGDAVRLGLEGMPTAEMLELLRQQGVTVCFFLRAEEIAADPDMVRRIACTGHTLGCSCPEGGEEAQRETAALLWETARVRTILYTMPEGSVQLDGAVVFPSARTDLTANELRESMYIVTSELEIRNGDQTIIFPSGDGDITALQMLLYYFDDQGFTVVPLREPDGGDTPIVSRYIQ